MCSYLTLTTDVRGSARGASDWIDVSRAVVAFDHPVEAPLEHALSIDLRGSGTDPAAHVMVELDAASARRLAETILEALESQEAPV